MPARGPNPRMRRSRVHPAQQGGDQVVRLVCGTRPARLDGLTWHESRQRTSYISLTLLPPGAGPEAASRQVVPLPAKVDRRRAALTASLLRRAVLEGRVSTMARWRALAVAALAAAVSASAR